MKTSTIISVTNLINSKNFENKVTSLVNSELQMYRMPSASEIYISDAGIRNLSGYGQYQEFITIEVDGVEIDLTRHTTDAPTYDFYNNDDVNSTTYSNALKSLLLSILNDRFDVMVEKLDNNG